MRAFANCLCGLSLLCWYQSIACPSNQALVSGQCIKQCPAGTIQGTGTTGVFDCTPCSPGTWAAAGATSCSPCYPGRRLAPSPYPPLYLLL
jgi:hypothetical protein